MRYNVTIFRSCLLRANIMSKYHDLKQHLAFDFFSVEVGLIIFTGYDISTKTLFTITYLSQYEI
jgi:hypothetical protein